MASADQASPILRIPPEILSLIFLACEPAKDSLNMRTGPWKLSYVCRQWRATSLGLSSLWSTFWTDIDDRRNNASSYQKARLFFQRAKEQPLSITLSRPFYARRTGPPVTRHCVLDACAEVRARWRDVTLLHFPSAFLLHIPDPERSLDILESLHLDIYPSYGIEDASPITIFRNAPRLRTVYLSSTVDVQLPWPTLTHFTSSNNMASTILSLLQHATNLRYLDFEAGHPASMFSSVWVSGDASTQYRLDNLKELDLADYPGPWISQLSGAQLTRLRLNYRVLGQLADPRSLLHRCSSRIKFLQLWTHFYTIRTDILPFLYELTGLEELEMMCENVDEDVLKAISSARLMPRLRRLRIQASGLDLQAVVAMLAARRKQDGNTLTIFEIVDLRIGLDARGESFQEVEVEIRRSPFWYPLDD